MRAILAVNLPVIFVQFVFSGVTLAWQIAIFVARFRLMVISSLIEKLTYVGAITVLYLQRRMTPPETISAFPDAILAVLFVISFAQTKPSTQHVEKSKI